MSYIQMSPSQIAILSPEKDIHAEIGRLLAESQPSIQLRIVDSLAYVEVGERFVVLDHDLVWDESVYTRLSRGGAGIDGRKGHGGWIRLCIKEGAKLGILPKEQS